VKSTDDSEDEQILAEIKSKAGLLPDETLDMVGIFEESAKPDVKGNRFGFVRRLKSWKGGPELVGIHAFVSPKIAADYPNHTLVRATIKLSSAGQREKSRDRYTVEIVPNSLKPLEHVPEHWTIEQDGAKYILKSELDWIVHVAQAAAQVEKGLITSEIQDMRHQAAEAAIAVDAARKEELRVHNAVKIETQELEVLRGQSERIRTSLSAASRTSTGIYDLLLEHGARLNALGLIDEKDIVHYAVDTEAAEIPEGMLPFSHLDSNITEIPAFVQARLWGNGFAFPRARIDNLLSLLCTHDMIIVAGDSGTGKTSLAKGFVQSVGGEFHLIPVKPNWTSPEDLFGFYNPTSREYHANGFLVDRI
jgi:hypothetical protein